MNSNALRVSVMAPADEPVKRTDLGGWAQTVLQIEARGKRKQRAGMESLRTLAAARILKHQTKKGLQ